MDRNYFGNERGSNSSSSRKGKKSNNSDHKPKQPQRGLGVAQLEKIRLHTQYHHPPNSLLPSHHFNNINDEDPRLIQMPYSSSSYAFQPHIRFEDSQPRWQHANVILENQSRAQTNITQPFLYQYDSQDIDHSMKNHRSGYLDSESSDTQELDLELRLSL